MLTCILNILLLTVRFSSSYSASSSRGERRREESIPLLLEDRCFPWNICHGKQWHSQAPRPRTSSVPSSRSSRNSGLCPRTLLVSFRLGGGAATTDLVTNHQGGERERQSNRGLRLRAFRPATPAQSVLYIRKESAKGSALYEPVRRWAPSLPSAVTRSQSVGDQTPVRA